jgi:hypothetical protein
VGRLAIAHASYPGDKTVLAAVLLYLLVSAMASIPYVNWRKRIDEDIAGRSARYAGPTVVRLFQPQRSELMVDIRRCRCELRA